MSNYSYSICNRGGVVYNVTLENASDFTTKFGLTSNNKLIIEQFFWYRIAFCIVYIAYYPIQILDRRISVGNTEAQGH